MLAPPAVVPSIPRIRKVNGKVNQNGEEEEEASKGNHYQTYSISMPPQFLSEIHRRVHMYVYICSLLHFFISCTMPQVSTHVLLVIQIFYFAGKQNSTVQAVTTVTVTTRTSLSIHKGRDSFDTVTEILLQWTLCFKTGNAYSVFGRKEKIIWTEGLK